MTTAAAPGKIILIGEHAVVYGRPAIAAPVWEVTATAAIIDRTTGSGCLLTAPDIDLCAPLSALGDDQPLALITRLALARLNIPHEPDWAIDVRSTIPIASGLGSGAALSTALVRAIYAHAGQPITPQAISTLVFESERLYHGTPSGIDNTVIAHGLPIWFVKGEPPVPFAPSQALTLVIADSGIRAPTKETVGDVRRGWQADPAQYERWFDAIAAIAQAARPAIEAGDARRLGQLFDENQTLLEAIGVSSPPLERLIAAARAAGALGAKLSGGGRGGNVIALVAANSAKAVGDALLTAGANRVIVTRIAPNP
jgi:mevalonate kinase